jgi:spore germination protein KC
MEAALSASKKQAEDGLMKRAASLILILITVALGQGCSFPQKYRIEEIQNILILGLDTVDDQIQATIVVDSISTSSKAGEEKVTYKAYTMTGRTDFEISRKFHELTNKRITYYHLKYVLIGEDAARKGIEKYLNFLVEDHEPVFTHRLIISKGSSAKEFIEQTSSQSSSLAEYLDSLFTEKTTGKTSEVRLLDYAVSTKRPWTSLYIPVVEPDTSSKVQTGGGGQGSQASPSQSAGEQSVNVKLEGYAIFNEDRLVDFADGDTAMGVNFVINEMYNACLTVQDIKGQNASVEVMNSKAKIMPDYNEPLSAKIEVTIETNLDEYNFYSDIPKEEFVSYLEQQGSSNIQAKIVKAITLAQKNKADVLGIGSAFYHKDPVKWQNIKNVWPDIFAGMNFTVTVKMVIKRTYLIRASEG